MLKLVRETEVRENKQFAKYPTTSGVTELCDTGHV